MGAGEITGIKIENLDELRKPLIYRAKVSIPGYGERTGKRLFFVPNAFEKGRAARFAESKRTNPIYLHHASTVKDSVKIGLPEGYALEAAESPQSSKIGEMGEYTVTIRKPGDDSFVMYEREFVFPKSGGSIIPASSYSQIKQVFDFVHQQDHHTLTLREKRAQ